MSGKDLPEPRPTWRQPMGDGDLHRFEQPGYVKALLAAGVHAFNLGITLLDSQTRFESVNAALARETQASVDQHIGKTSREIVGDLATQIEPTYEKVLRTGKPASVRLVGQVRDTSETGYWFDHCFPILDKSQRVQHLGLIVVNVTLEKASAEIFNALATNSNFLSAQAPRLIEKFDESVRVYHSSLKKSLKELASPSTEAARKVDGFRLSMERLDDDIGLMRELIYAVLDQFAIPKC
jgi:PAS fold